MANYTVTKHDGQTFTVLSGNKRDDLSITLIGQDFVGFGQYFANNSVNHLENFYGSTPPEGALRGQLWYDVSDATPTPGGGIDKIGVLRVWTGSDPIDNTFVSATDDSALPANADKWIIVGPKNIQDNEIGTNVDPYTNIYVTNVYSTDGTFEEVFIGNNSLTEGTTINNTGFIPIPDSINDSTGVKLGLSTNRFRELYVRNTFTYGKFGIGDFTTNKHVKLLADTGQDYTLLPDPTQLVNLGWTDANERFNSVNAIFFNGQTLTLSTTAGQGVSSDLVPAADNSYDLGAVGRYYNESFINNSTVQNIYAKASTANIGTNITRFNTVYAVTFDGTATQAKYADLAERFEADAVYDAGTVVKIGGDKEITQTTEQADSDVFGVISDQPGMMMNAAAGNNDTHPYVAYCGRVPVKVVGKIKKGQRLTSSYIPGVAMAATDNASDWQCVFGRALENKETEEVESILVAVGAK